MLLLAAKTDIQYDKLTEEKYFPSFDLAIQPFFTVQECSEIDLNSFKEVSQTLTSFIFLTQCKKQHILHKIVFGTEHFLSTTFTSNILFSEGISFAN